MVEFYLDCYENIATIVSVAAIIVAIVVHDAFPKLVVIKKNDKEEAILLKQQKRCLFLQLVLAFIILVLTIFVWIKSYTTYCNWAVIPDLYGRTYDDAIQVLHKNGFNGQLALSSTNNNLTNSDCRVVWQSHKPDEEALKGTRITFVIDDCFSLSSTPLIQYAYKDIVIDQSQKLDYECDYRDTVQQMVEREREAVENGTPLEYTFADPHWTIKIDAANLHYEAYTSTWHGRLYTSANTLYSYKLYAGAMTITLEELVTSSAALLSGVALQPKIDNCTIVGKLIPISGQNDTVLCRIDLSDSFDCKAGTFFLPQTLMCGEYQFCFSIIDSDDQLYEWYHYITIVDNDD